MTGREIKKFLGEYRSMKILHAATLKEIQELEARKTALSAGFKQDSAGRVVASPTQHAKYEAVVEELVDIQKESRTELEELKRQRKATLDLIRTLDNGIYRAVLHLRYINCLKWAQVAELMCYSVQHAKHLSDQAIAELAKGEIKCKDN